MPNVNCPRPLSQEEIAEIDWNDYSIKEIDSLISCNCITEQDMVDYFNNEWWRDEP